MHFPNKDANNQIGAFERQVNSLTKNRNGKSHDSYTDICDIDTAPTLPCTPTLKGKFMSHFSPNHKNQSNLCQKFLSQTNKTQNKFGPKISFCSISSKEELGNEFPLEDQNMNLFKKLNEVDGKFFSDNIISHSEFEIDDDDIFSEKSGFHTVKNFLNTDSLQAAKDEDRFWRYEREEKFIGKLFNDDIEVDLEEKISKEKTKKILKKNHGTQSEKVKEFTDKRIKGIFFSRNRLIESTEGGSKKSVLFDETVRVKKYRVRGKPKNLFIEE